MAILKIFMQNEKCRKIQKNVWLVHTLVGVMRIKSPRGIFVNIF